MSERVAIVTGSSRGIGRSAAEKLAARGFRVVLTARRAADVEAAAAAIRAAHPGATIDAIPIDLAAPASVRAFADAFHALGLPLHVIVLDAGRMPTDPRPLRTAEGLELTFATNHLGHFLLTHLVLGDLVRAAPSRVVVVSSSMHRRGVGPGPGPDFDFEDLRAEKGFHPAVAYRNSKLANLWFAFELDRRVRAAGVTVVALSPGWVPETIARDRPTRLQRLLFARVLPHLPIARTLDEASDAVVHAATEPGLASGSFLEDGKPGLVSDEARSEAAARRLWDASLALCGLTTFGA